MAELFAGRYALGRLLGAGGAGRVFAARDERLHRDVAIKLVPASSAEPTARLRFVREARSAAAFVHPNAVALYDAGEANGQLYLVMELVVGQSLAERLTRGRLGPAEAERIMSGVLSALGAAHAAGIVHRDVKPGNVLLGSTGDVKLADFGIAKRLDDAAGDVTVIGDIVGTPKYLAPELVGGAPATASSDVYAAGVLLFEMLAGRPPFDADTPVATVLAHRDHPVPDVRALAPDVPDRLAGAAHTAMAKDPARRFASAAEMQAAVTGMLSKTQVFTASTATSRASFPATAVMPTPGYRAGRRSRWWIAVAAALIAGGTALALVVTGGDDPDSTASSSIAAAATTPATPTTVLPASAQTTLLPTTAPATVPVTTAAATTTPPDPSTIEGIIAVLGASPEAFGRQTAEVIKDLEKIRGNGRNAERRAREALQHAAEWVDRGELDPSVLDLLEPVLEPMAAEEGDQGDERDDGDD